MEDGPAAHPQLHERGEGVVDRRLGVGDGLGDAHPLSLIDADDPGVGAELFFEAAVQIRDVIGVDLDERVTRESRLRPYVLTSMRRQLPSAVYQAVKAAVAAGEPDAAPGFDLANEGVGLSRTGGQIDSLEPELDAVRADIVAGRIDVPQVTTPDDASWPDVRSEPPIVG